MVIKEFYFFVLDLSENYPYTYTHKLGFDFSANQENAHAIMLKNNNAILRETVIARKFKNENTLYHLTGWSTVRRALRLRARQAVRRALPAPLSYDIYLFIISHVLVKCMTGKSPPPLPA